MINFANAEHPLKAGRRFTCVLNNREMFYPMEWGRKIANQNTAEAVFGVECLLGTPE